MRTKECGTKLPGAFKENSGATSMRRVLAFGCFVQGAYLYCECARTGTMAALYAGMASEVGMLVLLFFTTWTDLKGLVLAVKGLAGRMKRGAGGPCSGE